MSYSADLLKDQKALVTGASSGIGEAVARHLAQAGAAVVVNYRSEQEDAEKIVQEIRAEGGNAIAIDYLTGTTLFIDGGMALYPAFAHGG